MLTLSPDLRDNFRDDARHAQIHTAWENQRELRARMRTELTKMGCDSGSLWCDRIALLAGYPRGDEANLMRVAQVRHAA